MANEAEPSGHHPEPPHLQLHHGLTTPDLSKGARTPAHNAAMAGSLDRVFELGLLERAHWWMELAEDLGPFKYADPRTEWDAIARYFDGTSRGIRWMYNRVQHRLGDHMTADGIRAMLTEHFGFARGVDPDDVMASEGFKRFCELVLSEEDKEIRRHSFEVAIRHLRTGALLLNPKRPTSRWLLYCYDYDELVVEGSYSPSIRKQKSFTGGILGETEVVARQTPVGANGSHFRNVDEFLIGDPWKRTGRVRWVHAVSPDLECLLALGQQYQLRVHAQLLLCRLDSAQPQAEVSRNRKDWSSVVFPAAYIDDDSRRSFDRYKAWYQRVASDAKESGVRGEKVGVHTQRGMPSMKIGIVQLNLMLFWSKEEDNVVLSISAAPQYLARWTTPASKNLTSWWGTLRKLSACCRRRQTNEYEPLATSEEDAFDKDLEVGGGEQHRLTMSEEDDEDDTELDNEDMIQRMFKQYELAGHAQLSTRFENTFSGVLRQLEHPNSVLRMGTHAQMALRILLNRSVDYLDIIEMYTIAINHCREILYSEDHGQADSLIVKVSAAKRELEQLLKCVEPFVEKVLPMLHDTASHHGEEALSDRLCKHHVFDMQNNFVQFVQDAKGQVRLCENIMDDYDRNAADQTNSMLNFLTIITFLVMPTQILTGLYGMNFTHMPELGWAYGYHFFFSLAAAVTLIFLIILACIPRPRPHR
mmetsp:Transcript_13598/g.39198  ORF Transcript_13598/g.39198 Transcript_13598/m.39198 type:complete len:700 (+) Transcript_13598:133-2232(+)